MIANAIDGRALPVYGDGQQVRDWLYVDDHCRGILAALERGRDGHVYNIGGNCALPNVDVIRRLLRIVGAPESLMTSVADRPGHDRRYALNSGKIERETGFTPQMSFETGLAATVEWYRSHAAWVERVRSGEYREFYEKNYGWRS
jgi:dTDP-glucose 4,6-dehydratase